MRGGVLDVVAQTPHHGHHVVPAEIASLVNHNASLVSLLFVIVFYYLISYYRFYYFLVVSSILSLFLFIVIMVLFVYSYLF